MALFLSLFLDISCHCGIGSLGFLLGLLGLLLFGFVEFLFIFLVWDFVAGCTDCLGYLKVKPVTLLLETGCTEFCQFFTIYLVVFCLKLLTLLIFDFGGSSCDDELCVLNGVK